MTLSFCSVQSLQERIDEGISFTEVLAERINDSVSGTVDFKNMIKDPSRAVDTEKIMQYFSKKSTSDLARDLSYYSSLDELYKQVAKEAIYNPKVAAIIYNEEKDQIYAAETFIHRVIISLQRYLGERCIL